jgi:hypothetical protein
MDRDELGKRLIENEERLRKLVYVDGDVITINVAYEYNIELKRCDSSEKILSWVVHLCEKTWITPEVIERFARLAAGKHGLKIPDA